MSAAAQSEFSFFRHPLRVLRAVGGSISTEFKARLHRGECLLCEGPMLCMGLLAFLGRTCIHGMRRPRQDSRSFLDELDASACTCLHCQRLRRGGRGKAA
jgi:hypothetical protein